LLVAVSVVCAAGLVAPARALAQEPQPSPAPAASPAAGDDAPLVAGTDVPAPKRRNLVLPEYPEDAKAKGIRGIVLIEVVIERDGSVSDARVLRSIPPLDEPALEAVRQWSYDVTKVDGKPVRVRLNVPITFSMKLPEVTREAGIPELRQGAVPAYPAIPNAPSSATVEADVLLDGEGRVAEVEVVRGDNDFAESLLRALRTWVFNHEDSSLVVSFRLKADFVRASDGSGPRVNIALSDLRRTDLASRTADASAPGTAPPAAPAAAPAAPAAPTPASPALATAPVGASSTPPAAAPAVPTQSTPAPVPSAPAAPLQPPAPAAQPPAAQPPAAAAPPTSKPVAAATPPPVETVHVPLPPQPTPEPTPRPTQPGFSAVRDVTLGPGVPDLTQGRRPVVPPFARMGGASGAASLQAATGPDLLKPAAEQMVASWLFRRTSTDRLRLVAVIDYGPDAASAKVRLVE
jgi:TonB family protein